MREIINIQSYVDALRNTGYKNTESALAEIIDNSIEAEAKNIFVICSIAASGYRRITEIAILDNGHGMKKSTLAGSLSIGEGTRRERKGMGRFGVGLPQASLHVSPNVEVYSWQAKKKPSVAYLDTKKIKAGKQKKIETPIEKDLPAKYKKYLQVKNFKGMPVSSFEKSGTLVIWKDCDRLQPNRVIPLFKRFQILLGRKFRYYIAKGHTIGLVIAGTSEHDSLILPNDPLYLMKNNMILGDSKDTKTPILKGTGGEPIFEPWENGKIVGTIKPEVLYFDVDGEKKRSKVEITYSIAKEAYHTAHRGRDNQLTKHLKNNTGISVVRADREIDFGKFDFFEDINEPQHRWWGCEIKFTPELDEAFGVANNKQQVELYDIDPTEYEDDEVKPMWLQLNKIIKREIKNYMYPLLEARGEGSRSIKKKGLLPEENTVAAIEEANDELTRSAKVKESSNPKDLEKLVKENLIEGGIPNPDKEEIKRAMEPPVKLEFRDFGGSSFIDVSTRMGNCWITINTGSVFYQKLYSHIDEQEESIKRAFNLLLMAYARAEDETVNDSKMAEAFRDVREKWGYKIRKYLESEYRF